MDTGAPPPTLDTKSVKASDSGVEFALEFMGAQRRFTITLKAFEVLETITGKPDLLTLFARNQPRILGVARRSLRAGAIGDPLILGSSHFTPAPVVLG